LQGGGREKFRAAQVKYRLEAAGPPRRKREMDEPRDPHDPIAAVTHRDPYPYYAKLVAERPLYRDDALGLWVATSAAAVTAVLTHESCRVRPPAEPVPRAIAGSPAGEIFRHLVRMNDGEGHCPFKRAVGAALDALGESDAAAPSRHWAATLAAEPDFAFRLPAYVTASLLGVPAERLAQAAEWTHDFVGGIAPGAGAGEVADANSAAASLRELFGSLLEGADDADGLLAALARQAERVGRSDPGVIVANGIGFLSQGYESTAGLIGNALLVLAAHPDLYDRVQVEPRRVRDVVREVLRHDSPVQNTRRFLARPAEVAGQEMQAGDAILVVLAAANRDPAANPDPHRFDVTRPDRQTFSGGAGVHACPGQDLAVTIAAAGVERLLLSGGDPARWRQPASYRASGNVRVPLWD
jgi:cytochrome P450